MGQVGWVHPGALAEKADRAENAGEKSRFSSGLTGAVDGDLDGLVVGGHQGGQTVDGYGDGETLAPARPAHKSQIAELGHLKKHEM